jgi:regulatory protein
MARAPAESAPRVESAGDRLDPQDKALRVHALVQLAQREYSRTELRRKLLSRAAADTRQDLPNGARSPAAAGLLPSDDAPCIAAVAERVDTVLDWLEANRYLSAQRFIESRVRVRSERFGNLRIRQELAQHGLSLPAQTESMLQSSEFDRALAVWARKFKPGSGSTADTAKQARFLAGRGFAGEVIWRVLRSSHSSASTADEEMASDSRATLPR